jgi:clan AA aspartic protease
MKGTADSAGRALLEVELKSENGAPGTMVTDWIDTGFTGDLVLTTGHINALNLSLSGTVGAVLADGTEVAMKTYACSIRWFGKWQHLEVVESVGEHALLGVGLLLDHKLSIDYQSGLVSLV